VTNVAAFGAFVDIGVHQDGLVHISAISKTFVKDPRDVVKSGDIVHVKVMQVDPARKRISLTLRLDDDAEAAPTKPANASDRNSKQERTAPRNAADPKKSQPAGGAFAEAMRRAAEKNAGRP
jgi:uncharacterized protein